MKKEINSVIIGDNTFAIKFIGGCVDPILIGKNSLDKSLEVKYLKTIPYSDCMVCKFEGVSIYFEFNGKVSFSFSDFNLLYIRDVLKERLAKK